jgi:hypothetical protein
MVQRLEINSPLPLTLGKGNSDEYYSEDRVPKEEPIQDCCANGTEESIGGSGRNITQLVRSRK